MPGYLVDLLPASFTGTIVFHDTPWFGAGSSHRDVGYASDTIVTVNAKLDLIQEFGKGLQPWQLCLMIDWYGPTVDTIVDMATQMTRSACQSRGLKFSLCFDKGIGNQSEMQAALSYANSKYFWSPAFLQDENGKLLSIEFGTAGSLDWPTLLSPYPNLRVLHWANDPVSGYSWIKVPNPDPINQLVSDNLRVYMPSASAGFDDHDPNNSSQSIWGGPARFAPYNLGQSWDAIWSNIRLINPAPKFIQIVTLSDHEERTGILGNLGFPNIIPDVILPTGDVIPNVSISLTVITQKTFTATATGSGVVRMEIWDDTAGNKLAEQSGSTITYTVPASIPAGHVIILQAVGLNDTVLAKESVPL